MGEAVELSACEWIELLAFARQRGWQPAGTAAPPRNVALDVDPAADRLQPWDGGYDQPAGQTVTREDACQLGEFLGAAILCGDTPPLARSDATLSVIELCRRGAGFLICRPYPGWPNQPGAIMTTAAGLRALQPVLKARRSVLTGALCVVYK